MSAFRRSGHAIPKPKYSFRRDTLPPLLGLSAFGLCMVGLNFQLLYARVQYNLAASHPALVQGLDTSPNAVTRPDTTPSLWIPKINVRAPVVFEASTDDREVQKALEQGITHYGDSSLPGEIGNTVMLGHSSGVPWAAGDYKFVFTLLDKLVKGDQIAIDYQGTRYIYSVTDSFVVGPYQTKVLDPTVVPTVTLITCAPLGSNAKRLVVTAEQVTPNPKNNRIGTPLAPSTSTTPIKLPSDSSSLWGSIARLFSR